MNDGSDTARKIAEALDHPDYFGSLVLLDSELREILAALEQVDSLERGRVDALIELLKRAGMYTSHHSYCYAGVDYVTCICGLEEFSKEVLEAVSESS